MARAAHSSGLRVQSPAPEGAKPGIGGTLVYFSCADCGVEESRVEKAGGQIMQAKFSIGEYGFVSLVSDTEGNMTGLHSRA